MGILGHRALGAAALSTALAGLSVASCGSEGSAPAAASLTGTRHGPRVSLSRAERSLPLRDLTNVTSAPPPPVAHEIAPNPNPPWFGGTDPVVQSEIFAPAGPPAIVNWLAQGNTNSPSIITGTPPDTVGAVGPRHFVQGVNGGLAIWDKSGNLLWGPKAFNVLWNGYTGTNPGNGCATRNDGDGVVLYDQLADRWFVSQFSVPNKAGPDYQCVAVSQTGDPTGAWFLYDFEYPFFDDYGKFSVWPDGYYAMFNDFYHKYGGADLCAYDRASMLRGLPATQQCFQQSTSVFSPLPASVDGPIAPPRGSPGIFVELSTNALDLWTLHIDWTTPGNTVLTGPTSIAVSPFSEACGGGACIPQPQRVKLDTLADRLMFRLAYRNFGTYESLTVNHSVTANNASGVRWYEIRSPFATPTVYQQGTYAPNDGNWRWMGSLAQDQAGDMGLGFSVSSGTIYASIAWTGRLASDALGTMGQGETIVGDGTAGETGATRWGDYSAMTVDPSDDCTFWYTNEYYLTTGTSTWDTRVASFVLPACAANDFSIGVSPSSQSVAPTGQISYAVTTASTKGSAETLALVVQDLPSGVSGAFNPTSVPAGGSSTLTLTATGAPVTTAPVTFTVIGKAPSAVHAATALVSIIASNADAGTDSGTASDSGTVADSGTTADSGSATDSGSDAGSDSGTKIDAGATNDSGVASDSGIGKDSGSDGTGGAGDSSSGPELDAATGDGSSDNGNSGNAAGCGCRTAGADAGSTWAALPIGALAILAAARRRRRLNG